MDTPPYIYVLFYHDRVLLFFYFNEWAMCQKAQVFSIHAMILPLTDLVSARHLLIPDWGELYTLNTVCPKMVLARLLFPAPVFPKTTILLVAAIWQYSLWISYLQYMLICFVLMLQERKRSSTIVKLCSHTQIYKTHINLLWILIINFLCM